MKSSKWSKFIVFSLLLLCCTIASASDPPSDFQAIHGIGQCASAIVVARFRLTYQSGGDWIGMLGKMYKCDDDALAVAIKAAGDHVDLRNALKILYLKDRAYIGSLQGSPREQETAEAERSEAFDRVNMEATLVGIK